MANLCKEWRNTWVFQHKWGNHRRRETRLFPYSVPFTQKAVLIFEGGMPDLAAFIALKWGWKVKASQEFLTSDSTSHPGLWFRHFILGNWGVLEAFSWETGIYHMVKYIYIIYIILILYSISDSSSTVYHVNFMARPYLQEAKLLEEETCRDIHPWAGCEPDVCNTKKSKLLESFAEFLSKSCLFDVLVLSLLTSIYQDVSTWDLSNHRARDLTWEKASSKGSKFGNGWKQNHGSSSITEGHHGNQVALGVMLLEKLNF